MRVHVFSSITFGFALMFWSPQPTATVENYTYIYDSSGRLTEVRTDTTLIAYTYDAAGNIVQRKSGPNPNIFSSGFEGVGP